MDYVLAWTPFLKAWSLLEDVALANVSQVALRTQQAVGNGNLTGATALWALLEETISNATDNVVRISASFSSAALAILLANSWLTCAAVFLGEKSLNSVACITA